MNDAMTPDQVLSFQKLALDESQSQKFKNGAFLREIDFPNLSVEQKYFWLEYDGRLLGLGEKSNDGFIRPKINFNSSLSDAQ